MELQTQKGTEENLFLQLALLKQLRTGRDTLAKADSVKGQTMTDQETKNLITETVEATVAKLKAAGMLRQGRTAREKTEELLRQYPLFKIIKGKRRTAELVERVENALAKIGDDPYCVIIKKHFFEHEALENIAFDLEISTKTARKHKQRLVGILSSLLFSDEAIQEIFFK
jgi:hypothetical protein